MPMPPRASGAPPAPGVAGIAVYAYTAVQIAIYGFFGAVSTAMVNPLLGTDIPWWVASLALIGLVQVFGYLHLELGAKVLGVLLVGEWGVMLAMAASVAIQGGAGEGFAVGEVFSFEALVAGAPGVALMFAFASSLGFEAAAVFGEEVKNPRRSIPRATYLSVVLIMAFFAFTTWMITVGYGPGNVVAEAGKALESGDTASFIYALGDRYLGGWAPVVMSIFVVTSTFAAALAFHNGIARYLFALGRGGLLPNALGRVHPKTGAPIVASVAQTAGAAGIIALFALLNADPIAVVFSWSGGIAVIGLLAAYLLVSLSVLVYFRRNRTEDAKPVQLPDCAGTFPPHHGRDPLGDHPELQHPCRGHQRAVRRARVVRRGRFHRRRRQGEAAPGPQPEPSRPRDPRTRGQALTGCPGRDHLLRRPANRRGPAAAGGGQTAAGACLE